jgi:DNA-binding HxlR family transcriptional regulator
MAGRTLTPPPDRCPLDTALALLAARWVPQIIWYLSQEPLRFGELRRALGGISAKVLAQRLRTMEMQGVIARKVLHTVPPQVEYSVTALGREFAPVFDAMISVGRKLRRRYGLE